MLKIWITICVISGSLLLANESARAAYSNYNSVLLGERAAGMGGAFTALSDDASASPFYNPATTILMKGSSLSGSVSVYNKYQVNLGEQGDFTEAPQRLNRGFFRSLPSSSASILNFKSFAAGLSILVPDYEYYAGQVKASGGTNSFLEYLDESLWVGGTFSARLSENDSAGLSVYYTARDLSRSVSDRIVNGTGTSAIITLENKNLTTNSAVMILGYHRKLSPTWSWGVSYRPESLMIAGEGSYYKSVSTTSPYSESVVNKGNLRTISKIPARVSMGFAREIKGVNTLSLDTQFYEGLSYHDLPELPEGAEQVDYRHVWNLAIGYEQVINEWIRLRLGYFTNRSSHPDPDPTLGIRQGDHVDMNGFSANLNIRSQANTFFTVGGYYSAGTGFSTQIVGGQLTLVPMSEQVFSMLVATGFSF